MNHPKNYYRVMLGKGSIFAADCQQGSFIGVDFLMDIDLNGRLPNNWQEFNREFIPIYLQKNPGKSKIAAGLACGALHTIARGIQQGDVILSPNGKGSYLAGEVTSEYSYHPGQILPHRRAVTWYPQTILRDNMSNGLRGATGVPGAVSNVSQYATDIEQLLGKSTLSTVFDGPIRYPIGLENELGDFLVNNWTKTPLGQKYDIFTDENGTGREYRVDTGRIDILAISKDKKELLVVELKRGRASDVVVGQIQRYMGYVASELAENGQTVRGVIIAVEKDLRLQRALQATGNIDFYRYQVSFRLHKE